MKKTLFMCALGLTIATSMVAGTMAIYTHSDDLLNGDSTAGAIAKKFYISTTAVDTQALSMKFAPGESATWTFEVTNELENNASYFSEVNTDLIVELNAASIFNWADFTIELQDVNGTRLNKVDAVAEGNSVKLVMPDEFKANEHKTTTYKLAFKWNDGVNSKLNDTEDTDLVYGIADEAKLPKATGFNVTVTGQQSTDNKAFINY